MWDIFKDSFDDNDSLFIGELVSVILDSLEYTSINSLNNATNILRKLGFDSEANDLVESFFQHHSSKNELTYLEDKPS